MNNPLVSVVIVTWNRKEDTLKAIQSVYDQEYRNVEIIVIDNGSVDGTVETLQQIYPHIRLITLAENRGASAGRNAGIAVAHGDIVFILDSDASLASDTLNKIAHKLEIEPEVGIIMCKVLNAYTKELDPAAGWIYPESQKDEQDTEFLSYSFSECGAAIRKEVFNQVGLFWDLLFFVGEGDELSLRAWNAGHKVLYWPQAVIYHRESPQKRVAYGKREYFDLRNSLYIYFVRYPWWMFALFAPLQIAISLFKGFKGGYIREVLPALPEVVRELPSLWRERRPISNRTARLYLNLQRQHGPLSWDFASWLKYKVQPSGVSSAVKDD